MHLVGAAMRAPGPVDVLGVVREIGLDIRFGPLETGCAARTSVRDMRLTGIVSDTVTQARGRMMVAHLLGHHLLHRDLLNGNEPHIDFISGDIEIATGGLTVRHDAQALHFAVNMLVPPMRLEAMIREGADRHRICGEFGMPAIFMDGLLQRAAIPEEAPAP